MKKNRPFKIVMLFFLLISLTNCDAAADLVIDCIVGKKPDLISKELKDGYVLQPYSEDLTFKMIHADDNDYFISDVSVEGILPPNMNYNILENSIINLYGIPSTKGTYEFTFTIIVEPYIYNSDGTDNLCGNMSSKKYKIIIY